VNVNVFTRFVVTSFGERSIMLQRPWPIELRRIRN